MVDATFAEIKSNYDGTIILKLTPSKVNAENAKDYTLKVMYGDIN